MKSFKSDKPNVEVIKEIPISSYVNNGLSLSYPSNWKVKEDPKNIWSEGQVSFTSKKMRVNLTWGLLEQAAQPSAKEFAEARLAKMKTDKSVLDLKINEQKKLEKENHDQFFTHLSITAIQGGFLQQGKTQIDVFDMHIYCLKTRRYIILSSQFSPTMFEEHEKIFNGLINSLDCHLQI